MKRNATIQIRLTEKEKQTAKKKADKAGVNLTDYIRYFILKGEN